MVRVLVTAVGGDIGQGVLKALALHPDFATFKTIGIDMSSDAPGLFLCDRGYRVAGAAQEKKYLQTVTAICVQEKINIAFVCTEMEQRLIARHRRVMQQKTKTFFVVQSPQTLEISMDKLKTYQLLRQHGIRTPETYYRAIDAARLIKKFGFPIVLKPSASSGSRNFHLVISQSQLRRLWPTIVQPVIQEYITNSENEEFTVGLFLSLQAKTMGVIAMQRQLRFGVTWQAVVDDFPEVVQVATRAAEAVGAVGPCNVQLRRDKNNQPCVIEINARLSSTSVFRAKLGFNEVRAALDYFLRKKTPVLNFKKAVLLRTWGELIVPVKKYQSLQLNGVVNR